MYPSLLIAWRLLCWWLTLWCESSSNPCFQKFGWHMPLLHPEMIIHNFTAQDILSWINVLTCIASTALMSILSSGLILLSASLAISMQFSLLSSWFADLSHFLISSMTSSVVDFSAVMMLPLQRTKSKWETFEWLAAFIPKRYDHYKHHIGIEGASHHFTFQLSMNDIRDIISSFTTTMMWLYNLFI